MNIYFWDEIEGTPPECVFVTTDAGPSLSRRRQPRYFVLSWDFSYGGHSRNARNFDGSFASSFETCWCHQKCWKIKVKFVPFPFFSLSFFRVFKKNYFDQVKSCRPSALKSENCFLSEQKQIVDCSTLHGKSSSWLLSPP